MIAELVRNFRVGDYAWYRASVRPIVPRRNWTTVIVETLCEVLETKVVARDTWLRLHIQDEEFEPERRRRIFWCKSWRCR